MSEKQLLGKVAMAAALGVTTRHSFVADPWAKMEAALSAGSKGGVVEVAGRQVEWQRDPTVRRPSAAVSRDAIEAFKAQFAARPTAGEDYLSRQEVADELGVRYGHPVIGEVWGHIREKMKGGAEAGTLSIGGRTVEWKCFYSARNVRLPYVSRAGLSAFKAEVGKLPGKAAPGQLPMSRLVEQIGCYLTNDVIVDFMARVKAEIAAGKTRGETPLHNGSVEWEMLKAVWGGSSKWGGVTPPLPGVVSPAIQEGDSGPGSVRAQGPP